MKKVYGKFACIIEQHMEKKNFRKMYSTFQIRVINSTAFDAKLRNDRFTLISFMGFAAILNTLQPFDICICNRENIKLTFSNVPQLMGKGFMANLYASLDSTCKSRISKMSMRFEILGSIPQLLLLN